MLHFIESFDHYTALADITDKWTAVSSIASAISLSAGTGRRGTASMRMTSGRDLQKAVPSAATYVAGAAFQFNGMPGSVTTIIAFLESATVHLALRLNADGSLTVSRNLTALATSAAGVITTNTYYYIELKGTINNTTGTTEVHVNGGAVAGLTLTGQDTQNGGTATVTVIQYSSIAAATTDMDDIYICDTTGSVNNDFLGDVRVDAYFPNGNGNSSQLAGSDGNSTDNYLLVDDATPDDDTTYVESSTSGQKDTYAFGNMAHSPSTIHGVQIFMDAKKDDAGARSICSVTRSNGADYDGATQALSTTYTGYMEILEEDPDTSAAWLKAGFDAAEFGVKVAA